MATADFYRVLWRHRLLIIVLTALIGGVAWYVTSLQPKIYEATSLVRVQQKIATANDAFGSLEAGARLAQTYATIVETGSIKRRVTRSLRGAVAEGDLSISAEPVGNIELLAISARSESPRDAARVANAATAALRAFIADTGTLRDQMIVVDRASVPTTPVSPRVKLTVALALLLGFLLNCALALLAEYLSDPLPDHAGMESTFGLPVLAAVPVLSFPKSGAIMTPVPLASQLDGVPVRAPAGGSTRVRERGA